MFKVGDYVVYGKNGVCQVEDIGPLDSPGMPKERIYYTLAPCYMHGSKIFTPADNSKVTIRPVISKEEADSLIDEMKDIEFIWTPDDKKRELEYKAAFLKCDCRELVKIIKAIYTHKQSRLAEGKKLAAGDEKNFKIAEDSLYGELAIPFNMQREEVKEYIIQRLEDYA